MLSFSPTILTMLMFLSQTLNVRAKTSSRRYQGTKSLAGILKLNMTYAPSIQQDVHACLARKPFSWNNLVNWKIASCSCGGRPLKYRSSRRMRRLRYRSHRLT